MHTIIEQNKLKEGDKTSNEKGYLKMGHSANYMPAEALFPLLPDLFSELTDEEPQENASDEFEEATTLQAWLQKVENQYGPVAADAASDTSNHYHSITVLEHTYPLHFAVAEGKVELLKHLLEQGFNINSLDNLNSTPLHVAVTTNQFDAVEFLLAQGADINAYAYENINPINLALIKGHYDIAEFLLKQPQLYIDDTTAYAVFDVLFLAVEKELPSDLAKILNIVELLASQMDPAVITIQEDYTSEELPFSVLLKVVAASTADSVMRDMILKSVEQINEYDNTESIYLDAKLLMHVLPIAGTYKIQYDTTNGSESKYEGHLSAEGHFANYTVDAADQLLNKYLQQSNFSDPIKLNIFSQIQDTLHEALKPAFANADPQVSADIYESYQNGNTILLPTGWEGHFITTILDGKNGYLMVSNTGMAYESNESGSIFYKMHHPERITPEIIQAISMNENQFFLEYDLYYQLGLEKIYVLPEPPQTTGNCGWRSVEVSVEALAFLGLIEQGYSYEEAEHLAHDWYLDWYQFAATEVLSNYLANDPRLGIEALSDILTETHLSLFQNDEPINPDEWTRAQLIVEAMSSSEYIHQFSSVANEFAQARPELIEFMQKHGLEPYHSDSEIDFDINDDFNDVFGGLLIHENSSHTASTNDDTKPDVLTLNEVLIPEKDILTGIEHPVAQSFAGSTTHLESIVNVVELTSGENTWQKDADQMLVLYDIS